MVGRKGSTSMPECSPREKENNLISVLLCQAAYDTHTPSTCQRKEHFSSAMPAQLIALKASIIVKTREEKLLLSGCDEGEHKKHSFG